MRECGCVYLWFPHTLGRCQCKHILWRGHGEGTLVWSTAACDYLGVERVQTFNDEVEDKVVTVYVVVSCNYARD